MIQRSEELSLALKPCDPFWIVCERLGKDLECDIAAESRVLPAIHVTHPAAAEQSGNLIHTKPVAGRQRHDTARIIQTWLAGSISFATPVSIPSADIGASESALQRQSLVSVSCRAAR